MSSSLSFLPHHREFLTTTVNSALDMCSYLLQIWQWCFLSVQFRSRSKVSFHSPITSVDEVSVCWPLLRINWAIFFLSSFAACATGVTFSVLSLDSHFQLGLGGLFLQYGPPPHFWVSAMTSHDHPLATDPCSCFHDESFEQGPFWGNVPNLSLNTGQVRSEVKTEA